MAEPTKQKPQGSLQQTSPKQPTHANYQDKAQSLDSKLKAAWDGEMEDLGTSKVTYRKAFVLLLSWDKDVDDLHTEGEVGHGNFVQSTYRLTCPGN